jgi:hypothetical protein
MGNSIVLLIFTIYMQVHALTGFFMSYVAVLWDIVIATAEMTGPMTRESNGCLFHGCFRASLYRWDCLRQRLASR